MSGRPVVVIGAGAAGLMAAIHAAGGSRRVVLLERTADGGRKILISGGGRCNILPGRESVSRFVTDSPPPLLRHVLRGWPLDAQRRWFENELGLPLTLEPDTGKLFPTANRARVVRDTLVGVARQRGVEVRFRTLVAGVEAPQDGAPWRVLVEGDAPIEADRLVVATGGLSVPSTGSDGAGLGWLRVLGHTVHPLYPALTPLTGDAPAHQALSGVSLTVRLSAPGRPKPTVVQGGFLFTHRGWSGPAVLDISHLAVRARKAGREQPLLVQWGTAPEESWDEGLREGGRTVAAVLRSGLPERLAELLLRQAAVEGSQQVAQLRRADRQRLVALLVRYPLPWSGDEGYRKAEVTGGGVALDEVVPHTMESRRHSGLHICGEALDAFGPIGGHNFQWAWATGRQAGVACR